jgi:hypothetical protein
MTTHHIGSYLPVIRKAKGAHMSNTSAGHQAGPDRYQIRVKGHLGTRWAARFDGMTLTTRADGTADIDGPVADQAALHGLLRTLGGLGLPLVSVTQVGPGDPDAPTGEPP